MTIKILEVQPTENKPYVVEDYPYGFRLRTKIRYWIETTKRGQRFIAQTLNPKSNLWNKPKKSTYSQIMLMGLNDKNYITYVSKSLAYSSLEEVKKFNEKFNKYFSEYQKKEMTAIIGMSEVYDKVEYTISTRKFRHKVTGEITECIPLFNMNEYEEVDDKSNVIDREKVDKEQKDKNILLNKTAVGNAINKGLTAEESINSFNRS